MKKMKLVLLLLSVTILFFGSCKGTGIDPDFVTTSPINVGTLYAGVSISEYGTHSYSFVASGDGTHTIRLTNLGSDMTWYLYSNPSSSNPGSDQWVDNDFGSGDEIDTTFSLTGGVTYYVDVDEWDGVNSSYDLQITYP